MVAAPIARAGAAVLVVGALAATVAAPAGAHPAKLTCRSSGRRIKTVAADARERLFSVDRNDAGEYGGDVGLYGCLRPAGRVHLLGALSTAGGDVTDVSLIAFGGGRAAYRTSSYSIVEGKYTGETTYTIGLTLVNLRTGRAEASQSVGSYTVGAGPPPAHADVVAVKVSPAGQAAWVVQGAGPGAALYVHDSRGTRLLDPNVDPGSLAFNGSTLSWTRGGTRESVTLS